MGSIGANKGSAGGSKPLGEVDFPTMMKLSDNRISFDKAVTISPQGYIPETGRKKDLGDLLNKYNITETVINMYDDKSGKNDLERVKTLGFEVMASHRAKSSGSVPDRLWYYVKRK